MSTGPQRPSIRPQWLVLAALVVMTVVLLAVMDSNDPHRDSASRPPSPAHTSTRPAQPTAPPAASGVTTTQRNAAKANISKLIATVPEHQAFVAALNMHTGASYSTGSSAGNWTASSYKLVLVEILLLQNQDDDDTLSDFEDSTATRAIENSDNVAGYQLWIDVGRNPGMQAALPRLGMNHAVANGSDPAFTKLTAPDAIALVHNLVSPSSPLTAASRSYVLNLMANVESDQRWGVGAATDPNSKFYNKNGWLAIDNGNGPDESDDGRWVVSSVGIVTVGGDQVLMASFTEHMPDLQSGVRLVESMAKAARTIVAR